MSATSESAPQSTASVHQNIVPSEVGWQFIPQYYSVVNKQPSRLHCFYTKNSTFIHGTEGDEGRPCLGQQEIHQKIMAIGFENCKVFIHSVDAQSSADGGIILQVIGEMTNRGEAWRKFVQTFFLAPQPNGYFVLNDIFRFLKEESVEDEEVEEHAELPAEETVSAAPVELQEPEPVPPVKIPSPAPPPVEPVAQPPREPTPEPEPEPEPVEEASKPQPNGVHHEPEPEHEIPAVEEPVKEEPTPIVEEPSPAPAAVQPTPSPKPAQATVVQPTPVPAQPAAPERPKGWASVAKANSSKWGGVVEQESKGISIEAAATPSPPPQPPRSNTQTPSSGTGPRGYQSGPKGGKGSDLFQQAMSLTTPSVFVKGLVDPIKNDELKDILTKVGGPIKEIEYVRQRACAFVEYEDLESAKKAMLASLPTHQGGGGGITLNPSGVDRPLRIVVEVKKERGDRPPPRNFRGGAPNQGYERGNFRGGANRGRGRGIPSGKAM